MSHSVCCLYFIAEPLLEHMLHLLEDIRETQRIHSHQLNTLQRKGNANEQSCRWEIPEGVSFPLRTIEDANLMNTKLQDSGFKNGLVSRTEFLGVDPQTELICDFWVP